MTVPRRWGGKAQNLARLDGCAGPHRFVAMTAVPPVVTADLRCLDCRGVVSTVARYWYEKGLDHGQRRATRERAA